MYRILVVGDGYTATTVAAYFRSKNQKVFCLIRRKEHCEQLLRIGADPIVADLSQPQAMKELPVAQFVVITAPPKEVCSENHLQAIKNFFILLQGNPVPTFILYISSVEVWGDQHGIWVDESVTPNPDTDYGKVLVRAESQMLGSGYPAAIFRIGTVYGPGQNAIEAVRKGNWPGRNEDCYLNLIHREDFMQSLPIVFKRIKNGQVLIGVDDESVLQQDFYHWLCRELGVPPPEGVFKSSFHRGVCCKNSALKKIGFQFRYPTFREGYLELIKHERQKVEEKRS